MLLKKEIIKKIQSYCLDKPINKVWLFGSYARNEATENSDIDLLVDIDFSQQIVWDYFDWWNELERITHKKNDFVSEGTLSKYVVSGVEKDKILIYEKGII